MVSKFLKYSFLIITLAFTSCSQPQKYTEPTIDIQTYFGDIIVELYPAKAPKTVAAFLSYVDSGYFKNTSFYRVLKAEDEPSSAFKSELIQGGLWQSNYKKQITIPGIKHETTKQTGILHKDGVISLARTTPGTASTEFFICVGDQPSYDYGGSANPDGLGFAAFGKVIKGMDIVNQIHKQPDYKTSFAPPIKILNIKRL